MKLVFDLYDFDSNGFIDSQDVKTLLSHTINIPSSAHTEHNTIPLLNAHTAKM
jgi:Ca2+-binding EF-hand superfamily protein